MIQEKHEAKKINEKATRARQGCAFDLNSIFEDLDLEQDKNFTSLLDYQLFDKVRKKIKTASENSEKDNEEMEQEPIPCTKQYDNSGIFPFYPYMQQTSFQDGIFGIEKFADQAKQEESPKNNILSISSVKQLQGSLSFLNGQILNTEYTIPKQKVYYRSGESEEDEDDEEEEEGEEKSTAPIDFDIENDQINSNSMLQESPSSYTSSYSQRCISSPIVSFSKHYQTGSEFLIMEQNKVKRKQKNHAMYKKYRCQLQQDMEQYNILQLENTQENIDLIHNYTQSQQFNQSGCVLKHKYIIEEDSYIFLITEQFESFLQENPMATNFQLIITSIQKICEFLLHILENKIIQLEIKAEHLCWNANGEIKLGFEVFKNMTKSQSFKSSKFMQIETSKKFCEQILQALKEVSVGMSYEIKNDLNRFIDQQEQQEEKCTLQQFLKHPLFQQQYLQIC